MQISKETFLTSELHYINKLQRYLLLEIGSKDQAATRNPNEIFLEHELD